MAIIKITGTKQGESVQLVKVNTDKTRTPIGNTIVGYPYNFKYVIGTHEGSPTRQIRMSIAYNGKSHLIDMGNSSLAKSIIDSLASVVDPVVDELFEFSFYQNKKGYNSISIKRLSNEEKLSWSISTETKDKLIVRTKKKDGTTVVDSFEYDELIKSLTEELALRFPKSASVATQGVNALDSLDDTPLSAQDADDVFDTPIPKAEAIKTDIGAGDIPWDNK